MKKITVTIEAEFPTEKEAENKMETLEGLLQLWVHLVKEAQGDTYIRAIRE